MLLVHTIRSRAIWLAAFGPAFIGGCTSRYVSTDHGPQAYYRTGFPQHDTSRELERLMRSVKRLHVTGHYETFMFDADARVTREQLRLPATYAQARATHTFTRSKSGTATAIERAGDHLQLITNAHTTRWPDTVVSYFATAPGQARRDRIVESVAILRRQSNVIVDVPGTSEFVVVARDTLVDVALISAHERPPAGRGAVPLARIRQGDPARLVWGSFVYVLGYPRGYPMVTRAVVSDPRRDRDDGFLLDGLFNRGISGGLVLAVRGDTDELEWVGLATSAAAQSELVLVPENRIIEEDGILMPYRGNLYVEQVTRIDYGITFSVPMTAVARFLRASGHRVSGGD
jgi:hypothetical protein